MRVHIIDATIEKPPLSEYTGRLECSDYLARRRAASYPSSTGNSMLTCQRIAQIANHIQHQLLDIKDVEHCEIVDAEQHGQRTICIVKMKTARRHEHRNSFEKEKR